MATFNLYHGNSALSNQLSPATIAAVRADIVSQGVFMASQGQGSNAGLVSANLSTMTVTVMPFDWTCNGYWGSQSGGNATVSGFTAPGSGTTNYLVTAQLQVSTGTASVVAVAGATGAGTDPTLSVGPDIFQIGLARVAVAAGTGSLTAAMVTDLRYNTAFCGFVMPPLHGRGHAGGGVDAIATLEYPEGTLPTPLSQVTDPGALVLSSSYTVPNGKTLYLLSAQLASGASLSLTQSGGATCVVAINNSGSTGTITWPYPLIVGAAGAVSSNSVLTVVRGVLLPASGRVSPLTLTLPLSASTYTVPGGYWLVISQVYVPSAATSAIVVGGANLVLPGYTAASQYVGFGGSGALATGMGLIDTNNACTLGLRKPLLLPGGQTLYATVSGPVITGYLYPQTW